MPTDEARMLIEMTRDVVAKELAPRVDAMERARDHPHDVFQILGAQGLLSLAYPEEYGGGGQPYEVYLQVVEEIATCWMSVAVGVSVHSLTMFPVYTFGTAEQKQRMLPGMLSGEQLGAYGLSEPNAGSDVSSIATRAEPTSDGTAYILNGSKAWISHAGHADFYTTFARTSEDRSRGLSCFIVPKDTEGLSFGPPERKMGLHSDIVSQVHFENAKVDIAQMIGEPGQGMPIALAALDSGRLGIAAAATGLAQSALNVATAYAKEREQFGRRIADFQGLAFMLADMEAAVTAARATYLSAARMKDAGMPVGKQASVAKMVATDAAMKVTTDAVQVLGGAGYTEDFPAERYFRDAKVTQIFEGTNQIQRLVISRALLTD